MLDIHIATLFPEMCEQLLSQSIIGRARRDRKINVSTYQIRDFTTDPQRRVDDYPYGGGKGMVMQADPIDRCCAHIFERCASKPHVIYLSPKGQVLTQQKAKELLTHPSLLLICGHYEGVDQRVLDKLVDEEISIGDYVLTGGELPALVLTDVLARMCPGVLSEDACFEEESHFDGLLEYPQYTRPAVWQEAAVPEVLLSGHHENIAKWRMEQALEITRKCRPDMMETYIKMHPPTPKKNKKS